MRPPLAQSQPSAEPATFHPAVARWFEGQFKTPTQVQAAAWAATQRGDHALLAAPTGSGKTLAAFLGAIDTLIREGLESSTGLPDETRVIYVSPLRALSNDIEKNLIAPVSGIRQALQELGLPDVEIRTAVRTGDTPASQRSRTLKKPPHIYVTTPESLYILLTSESGRRLLRTVRTVIVDEIHALISDKRGSHLALSLERLAALTGRPLQRVGVSATQKPIERVAEFLVGSSTTRCSIVDTGHSRDRDLAVEVPSSPLEAVMSGEVWEEVYSRIVELVQSHRTTLVFVNTRRLCERLARRLADLLGEARATSHHGSLSREHRLNAEQRLKAGELSVLVATASLELGIDIGDVDLVIQIGSTRSISAFLQRVGRSGHSLGATPKGRIFPLSRDELCESAALLDAVKRGELDQLRIPQAPLDILAQQIVAATAAEGEWREDDLFELVRRAYPYRNLTRETFDAVVDMLARGFATPRGRRAAHLHRDTGEGVLRPRRGARLSAITSGGAIPDLADYEVLLEPEGLRVGSLNEDFAIESMVGDIFQLGNQSYVIRRVEPGRVRVEDARGAPPTIPFWLGEAPSRSDELSSAVGRLRRAVADRVGTPGPLASTPVQSANALTSTPAAAEAMLYLTDQVGLSPAAAEQLATYLSISLTTLGTLPDQNHFALERFFDETGGMHVVLHAPLGARINRAWGLTLRKCFCRKFDFELQAAANDDAIILSMGPTHSFQLEEVWNYVRSASARDVLIQALLVAPVFGARWRWNTQRALAVLRFRGGRKVPARFQRMDADDLLTLCFPDQIACAENLQGEREVPDHPLVNQTVDDVLTEAMDAEGLLRTLRRIESGEVKLFARDVTEPSPFAAQILTAKPYAFLDDAPLEERRTQAVFSRRWLDASQAKDLGALNPAAIEQVLRDAWPDPRNADELVDALELLGFMTEAEGRAGNLGELFQQLCSAGRAVRFELGAGLWVSHSRLAEHRVVHPNVPLFALKAPKSAVPTPATTLDFDVALREILRSRLEALGPVTAAELATSYDVSEKQVTGALLALEGEGVIFQGSFRTATGKHDTAPQAAREWCERRLLARIHRATIERLRAEIEPVTQQTFLRFLLRWQRLEAGEHAAGPGGTANVVEQLEGYEAAAGAWESELLRARVDNYEPNWLDSLCLSGRLRWLRRSPSPSAHTALKSTLIALVPRAQTALWQRLGATPGEPTPLSADAERMRAALVQTGASFFEDLERSAGLLRSRAEAAMSELVARGLVTSDSYAGVRALLGNSSKQASRGSQSRLARARRASGAAASFDSAGRWTLLQPVNNLDAVTPAKPSPTQDTPLEDSALEHLARVLLRRWGVVFRALLDRESDLPPWRDLLRCYRRLESRGEIRGGRFVAGFSGEQYALPDAITSLRAVKRAPLNGSTLVISAADPLNLVGIISPGRRVASLPSNRILLRDGVPTACREGTAVRALHADIGAIETPPPPREDVELLTRRNAPAALWLGRGAARSLAVVPFAKSGVGSA